ncbi:unnamed protein product [Sphagnum troendelagicum]|uniref:Secreted protein n=1 Tax=Sphagnum troendelagicum TaxID=128251 RepID=A0ABP0TQT9_9BRYO
MALILIAALMLVALLDGTQLQLAAAVRLRVPGNVERGSCLSNCKRAESGDELQPVAVDVQAASTMIIITHGQQMEGVAGNHENLGRFEVEGVPCNHQSLPIFEVVPPAGTVEKRELGENSSNAHQRGHHRILGVTDKIRRHFRILSESDKNSPVPGSPGGNNGGD